MQIQMNRITLSKDENWNNDKQHYVGTIHGIFPLRGVTLNSYFILFFLTPHEYFS